MGTLEYIKRIARHYVPEWTPQESDSGTAFAEAFSFVMEQNLQLYDKLFDKHYYAFLNEMGADLPAPRSATGFVSFKLANGAPRGELVPSGLILYNDEIPYVLNESLYVTPAALTGAYFCWGDSISDALSSDGDLTIFDSTAPNLQRREWQIQHDWAFAQLGEGCVIELDFGEELPEYLEWHYGGEPQKPLPPLFGPERAGVTALRFISPGFTGGDFVSAVFSPKLSGFSPEKIEINISSSSLSQTRYYHQDIELSDTGDIYPFGKTLTQNDCFYISCDEAFSKKGAEITAVFGLSGETLPPESELPEPPGIDVPELLKSALAELLKSDVPEQLRGEVQAAEKYPEPVRLIKYAVEYWNGSAFVLLPGYTVSKAKDEEYCLHFICPGDMERLTLNGLESRWLRVRIIELSYVYMPLQYIVPKIRVSSVEYSLSGIKPSSVTLVNNLQTRSYSKLPEGLEIYEPLPSEEPSVYLGFDKPLGTQQISMLIDAGEDNPEQDTEKLVSYTYTGGGWIAGQTSDSTVALSETGLLKVFMPQPPDSGELFGRSLYWLRLDLLPNDKTAGNEAETRKTAETRTRLRLYMNSADIVQKSALINESFTINDSAAQLQLRERNITDLKVYAAGTELTGCKADAIAGIAVLELSELKTYGTPLEITAEYRTTCGFGGNCEPDMITRIADSVGYVQYVTNPLPINDGWSYDISDQMISVGTKKLRHHQRAVAAGDFEALAYEFAGGLIRCKCRMETERPGFLRLVYLPGSYPRRYNETLRPMTTFSNQLRAHLLEHCHPALAYGDRLKVREAEYKPVSINAELTISDSKDWQKLLAGIKEELYAFLDPVTGNFGGTGFDFDEIANRELLNKFFFAFPEVEDVNNLQIEPKEAPEDKLCIYIPYNVTITRSGGR